MEEKSIYELIAETIKKNQQEILKTWLKQILTKAQRTLDLFGEEKIKNWAADFLDSMIKVIPNGDNLEIEPYAFLREMLEKISIDGVSKGIPFWETATLTLSLKEAIFPVLQVTYKPKEEFTEILIAINKLIDKMGLFTFESFLKAKERVIIEQQKALLEVSVPVVKVWEKILLVPLIGMLDSARTQLVMETLLTAIEQTQAKVSILDISGIPVVDSLVAKHLIRTVSAAKLMGAECIITGIRSRISQTMVQLGVDLAGVVTRTTLADGLRVALDLTGQKITAK